MTWQDRAVELKAQGRSWTELPEILRKEFGKSLNYNKIRSAVRRRTSKEKQDTPEDIQSTIIGLLGKEHTLQDMAGITGQSERVIKAVLEDIKEDGYQISETDGKYKICRDIIPQDNKITEDWQGNQVIRFGLMGDTHFNSKYCQITHLHDFYDICQREGIEKIYNTGDIDEGEEMRTGHKYECYSQGADDHIAEIVKNYPQRDGIVTEFICGNHDASLIKRAGLDIGKNIASKRDDMKYLGMYTADINLTPNCRLRLQHPLSGSAYAISYKSQKMLDAMQGGTKPHILGIGHFHKCEYLFYRNVHTFQTGCFQAQTDFMQGKQLAAMVGGWVIEVHVDDDGTITRCKGEFIPYYRMVKDDFVNWR